jgi:hypothetical protein
MKNRPSPKALRNSLQLFRVARTFPGMADDRKLTLILNALRAFSPDVISSPVETVTSLARQFRADFGKNNLSAASKLLWLTFRSPFLIYDARAVKGLKFLDHNFKNQHYEDYYATWKTAYANHERDLVRAVSQLPKLQPFFGTWQETKTSLGALSKQCWFRERVFDNYLWELGEANRSLDASDGGVFC